MKKPNEDTPCGVRPESASPTGQCLRSLIGFIIAILALIIFFSSSLRDLLRFAIDTELYSYILIIPPIALYLAWDKRKTLPLNSKPSMEIALLLIAAGACVLAIIFAVQGAAIAHQNKLVLEILAFVFFFGGTCALFTGKERLSWAAFPLGFLAFIIPFPTSLEAVLNEVLQRGSAAVAHQLFWISNTPVFYHDLVFQLPNIRIEVAPECSGIRSSVVLLITSLLAARFFLRTPWKWAVLTLAVIPLAMLRNGLRVFTLGELCARIGPQMIDSTLHHHGGPLFFALSLVPLSLLLWWLRTSEDSHKWKLVAR